MKIAREAVESMMAEIEVGKIYRGKVVTIKEFDASSKSSRKDGLVTSANWPTSASNRLKTSSRSATKSGSSASASTTKPG